MQLEKYSSFFSSFYILFIEDIVKGKDLTRPRRQIGTMGESSNVCVTDQPNDRGTDGPKDGRTDGHILI